MKLYSYVSSNLCILGDVDKYRADVGAFLATFVVGHAKRKV